MDAFHLAARQVSHKQRSQSRILAVRCWQSYASSRFSVQLRVLTDDALGTCLGVHLAYTELRLATAEWFRRCGGSTLGVSATSRLVRLQRPPLMMSCHPNLADGYVPFTFSMEQENYFLIAPAGHKCEVVLQGW